MGSEVAKEELPINKEALTIRVWTSIALLGDFTKMTVQVLLVAEGMEVVMALVVRRLLGSSSEEFE